MKKHMIVLFIAAFYLLGLAFPGIAEDTKMSDSQKAKINAMLKTVKDKSKNIKPAKYEVTLPVSAAGARGAETRQADRFAVIWPDVAISPLTALAENMRNSVDRGEKGDILRAQLDEFKKTFPEYNNDQLLKDLEDISAKVK